MAFPAKLAAELTSSKHKAVGRHAGLLQKMGILCRGTVPLDFRSKVFANDASGRGLTTSLAGMPTQSAAAG